MFPDDREGPNSTGMGELGLRCTADGVALAGVPLLRTTSSGLAPRPAEELRALFEGAYGERFEPRDVSPGLDVIAKALNRGDLGRAMVAAVHLRLPTLKPEGSARVIKAENLLAKERRDWHGRWTTGDDASSESSNSEVMKPLLVSDEQPANDNFPSIHPSLMCHMMGGICIDHAHEPNYYEKTQDCKATTDDCTGLMQKSKESARSQFMVVWPDGTKGVIRFGDMLPISIGKPF